MTRADVLKDYDVKDGRIVSPGKFEGEPLFAPYFWDMALQGCSDEDKGHSFQFNIKREDTERKQWPELDKWLGRKRRLMLSEDSQGFVRCW